MNVKVKDNSTIVWLKNYREDKIILEKDDFTNYKIYCSLSYYIEELYKPIK